ncbi:nucleoside deaminase [Apibacter muscae]|uniref:tRNA-specific adenosine deaminase n=1 Tax=Apibacter muscae TaxID=2509004 RepID=A0A563DGH8_9FLAO|nr:nucleoside deaminase [Apibacter muscae]TWP28963.1 nucleoside deaminase [Apibacter muscae]
MLSHEYFMKIAIEQAKIAFDKGEVPVGAIVVSNNLIIAKAHNLTESLTDVTAHAEIQAITSASNYLGAKYLTQCTMYVTLEPCVMCAGALYWSQIDKIVVGASDERRGFISKNITLHPKTTYEVGILKDECSQILQDFFKLRR